eukprot:1391057-Amorphochlora_amoeboformis.AAC.1
MFLSKNKEKVPTKLPSDAKEVNFKRYTRFDSPFQKPEDLKKAIDSQGFKAKSLYDSKKTVEEKFMVLSFYVHGIATRNNIDHWVMEAGGFDECNGIKAFVSKSKEKVYIEEEELEGRFTMSRCPVNQVGLMFIPAT